MNYFNDLASRISLIRADAIHDAGRLEGYNTLDQFLIATQLELWKMAGKISDVSVLEDEDRDSLLVLYVRDQLESARLPTWGGTRVDWELVDRLKHTAFTTYPDQLDEGQIWEITEAGKVAARSMNGDALAKACIEEVREWVNQPLQRFGKAFEINSRTLPGRPLHQAAPHSLIWYTNGPGHINIGWDEYRGYSAIINTDKYWSVKISSMEELGEHIKLVTEHVTAANALNDFCTPNAIRGHLWGTF